MNKKVTKNDLVNEIFEKYSIDKKDISLVTDALFAEVKNALINGSKIELRGFGTFEICLRKGRESARNPKTGDIVKVEPHFIAKFRAGQELRKSLLEKDINSIDE